MAWPYYDITQYVPPNSNLAHNYWETNLMCHLLQKFKYREMYEAPVHEALRKFKKHVDKIEDEISHSDHLELHRKTKDGVMLQFETMAVDFEKSHAGVKMQELYTKPGVVELAILSPFNVMQGLIFEDTKNQADPHNSAQPRFTMGCQMCLPFMAIQEGTTPPIPEDVMKLQLDVLGRYDLADLHRKPLSELNKSEVRALKEGRDHKVIAAPRRPKP